MAEESSRELFEEIDELSKRLKKQQDDSNQRKGNNRHEDQQTALFIGILTLFMTTGSFLSLELLGSVEGTLLGVMMFVIGLYGSILFNESVIRAYKTPFFVLYGLLLLVTNALVFVHLWTSQLIHIRQSLLFVCIGVGILISIWTGLHLYLGFWKQIALRERMITTAILMIMWLVVGVYALYQTILPFFMATILILIALKASVDLSKRITQ